LKQTEQHALGLNKHFPHKPKEIVPQGSQLNQTSMVDSLKTDLLAWNKPSVTDKQDSVQNKLVVPHMKLRWHKGKEIGLHALELKMFSAKDTNKIVRLGSEQKQHSVPHTKLKKPLASVKQNNCSLTHH
jgi:hypothetical protein